MSAAAKLDETFFALGDPTRRAILDRLRSGETPLAKLAEPFAMSQTAVSRHVRVLEQAGVVRVEKRGRTRHCRLEGVGLAEASRWLATYEAFWTANLDALGRYLDHERDPA